MKHSLKHEALLRCLILGIATDEERQRVSELLTECPSCSILLEEFEKTEFSNDPDELLVREAFPDFTGTVQIVFLVQGARECVKEEFLRLEAAIASQEVHMYAFIVRADLLQNGTSEEMHTVAAVCSEGEREELKFKVITHLLDWGRDFGRRSRVRLGLGRVEEQKLLEQFFDDGMIQAGEVEKFFVSDDAVESFWRWMKDLELLSAGEYGVAVLLSNANHQPLSFFSNAPSPYGFDEIKNDGFSSKGKKFEV